MVITDMPAKLEIHEKTWKRRLKKKLGNNHAPKKLPAFLFQEHTPLKKRMLLETVQYCNSFSIVIFWAV